MKKQLLAILLMAVSTSTFAQLKVNSEGRVAAGTSILVGGAKLTAGDELSYNYNSNYKIGIHGRTSTGYYTIGVKGSTYAPSNAFSIAVQGIAGGGASGHLYGVFGALNDNTKNGAGIVGTLLNHTGITIPGRYAGYFDGPVRATEDITAQSFITPSDLRLKENVISLRGNDAECSALNNVLSMDVIKFNYIDNVSNAVSDTVRVERKEIDAPKDTHYGLSAQQLQKIYPDLVKEGQNGYLGVNYVELVPILIRSIQELKQELDELRKGSDKYKTRSVNSKNQIFSQSTTDINKLYQNTPNPFKEQTVIRFSLANDVKDAAICIFDMTGKTIKKLPVSSGMDSVSIGGYELGEGMFLYSLIVNGQEIATKKMVISK